MIDTTKPYADILKAVALGDSATTAQLTADLTADEHQELFVFATAVMSICLGQRFEDDSSREAILGFVNELRENFAEASTPVKPLAVEAIIRAFAGEEHLLDEVSTEDQMNAQYPLIRKIVAESELLRNNLDQLVNEAYELVDEWESEES